MPIPLPFRFSGSPLLWTVDDVYTAAECQAFVARIEAAAPSLATNNPIYRDQDRVIEDEPTLAADLFVRLRPHLPPQLGPLRLVGLNARLRFYRYRPGQRFLPHMDHWYRPDERHITLHTVLVYFNDGFAGGETRFTEQLEVSIAPRRGSVAIFQHKVRHEGCEVRSGVKYALRTDTIYEADEPIAQASSPEDEELAPAR